MEGQEGKKMLEIVGVVVEENMDVVTLARGSVAVQEVGLQVGQLGPNARTCSFYIEGCVTSTIAVV